ncbi:MAG: cobalamin biosynthesis protein, partial [Pseudomonadota bacterium]
MTAGRFFVIGVGPGDPELLTLKAARLIAEADVVAFPETRTGGFAAAIAAEHIGRAERFGFVVPMTGDGAADAAYDGAAVTIDAHLTAGRTVALLCEGDPMLYGSAASIMARLQDRHHATVVPGVIAAMAAAAAAGTPLARGSAPVTIMPATAERQKLQRALDEDGAVVIYKVGRHFDEVAGAVQSANRNGTLVCHATLPEEIVSPLKETVAGGKPYFSAIVLPARSGGATAPDHELRPDVAVVALSQTALTTAQKAASALRQPGRHVAVHGLSGRVEADQVDLVFQNTIQHIRDLFVQGVAVVGICAAGIAVRAIAPVLSRKHDEPPLIVLSPDGGTIVPLLGAHRGGGAMAATLAGAFETRPSITTKSETTLGFALDDPPAGYVVADPLPFKALAATYDGNGTGTADDALSFLPIRRGWAGDIRATIGPPEPHVATYIVQRIALGMGAERGAEPHAAIQLARASLDEAGVHPRAVAVVVSLDKKADEPALHAVAADLGVPFRVFDDAALAAMEPQLVTPSAVVEAAVGVKGVAEGAALAAAGADGSLLLPKRVGKRVTAALAQAPRPIPSDVGRAQGHLVVIGTGPGARSWRTAETVALLARADAFVGYSLYLDLVEDLRSGQTRHDFPLGDEAERTRFALELAGTGQTVALISSGDPGIYAMASLAAELLHRGGLSEAARRVHLTMAPGISAAQAAAARVGAPFGHDFAYISLSDLMTPWPVIRARLEAVAAA